MPIRPKSCNCSTASPVGEFNRDRLTLSRDVRLYEEGFIEGGLLVANAPLAIVIVLMLVASSRVLLNIVAPASEPEKRGGKKGRGWCNEFEKNSGDAGVPLLIDGPEKLKGSKMCLDLRSVRALFRGIALPDLPAWLFCSSKERFVPNLAKNVDGPPRAGTVI